MTGSTLAESPGNRGKTVVISRRTSVEKVRQDQAVLAFSDQCSTTELPRHKIECILVLLTRKEQKRWALFKKQFILFADTPIPHYPYPLEVI